MPFILAAPDCMHQSIAPCPHFLTSFRPARPARLVIALLLASSLLLLTSCAFIEERLGGRSGSDPASADVPDRPDAFKQLEQANLKLGQEDAHEPDDEANSQTPAVEAAPHLWAQVVNRFTFTECPPGSSAEQWARWYGDRPDYMERVLTRAHPWLPDIAAELEQRQLPGELALLPIVESAYDPFAYSHGRAAGLWQFVSATARERGIVINEEYDGRRDVWASTRAALDYLTYLHGKFEDWNLALAAYNGGQGRVQRALQNSRRNGGSDHWESLRLPRETLGYVPKLHGLGCLFSEPARYGFELPVWDNHPRVERIELNGPVDIVVLAAHAELDIAELVAVNPGLNGHLTPPHGPHHLLVPAASAERVRLELDRLSPDEMLVWEQIQVRQGDTLSHLARRHGTTVPQLREANNLTSDFLRAGQSLRLARSGATPSNSPHAERYAQLEQLQRRLLPTERFHHRVLPGESLWIIARRYGVGVDEIKRWNNLRNDLIRPGDRIVINMAQPAAAHSRSYTVKSGDSLWLIARRHQVSVRDLLRWNNLSEGAILRPGQVLTIRGGRNA